MHMWRTMDRGVLATLLGNLAHRYQARPEAGPAQTAPAPQRHAPARPLSPLRTPPVKTQTGKT